MARRLAEAIEDARLASEDELGVASGLAWTLTDILEMRGGPRP